jgi:LacI family transcriptional regulator
VPVTIKEVADRAGVSIGTVSNVMNRPEIVSRRTRDRVQAAINELGFVRNESARHLRVGRSRTIGLVVLDVANPFFTDVARGVEDEANKAGLAVILCNSDDDQLKEDRYLDVLEEHRVHGVLITPVEGPSPRLERLQRRGTPIILVDSPARSEGQCSVAVDDVMGGDLAMSHLLEAGHERIAYVAWRSRLRQVEDRREGALRALRRAGLPGEALMVIDGDSRQGSIGREAGAAIAAMPARSRPTAVFCANDLMAAGFLTRAGDLGLAVPGAISVAGFDGTDLASYLRPTLTTITTSPYLLGGTATSLLLDVIAEHPFPAVVESGHPALVVRASTGPAPRVTG